MFSLIFYLIVSLILFANFRMDRKGSQWAEAGRNRPEWARNVPECFKLSKGLRPHAAGPLFFWWNGGYEAKWLRTSGSLAWLGACERLGKRRKDQKVSSRSDQSWRPGGLKAKLENEANMDPTSSKNSSESFK